MNTTNFYGKRSSNSENDAIRIRRFPSPDISEESDLSDSQSYSEFSQTTRESETEEEELILSEDESDDNIAITSSNKTGMLYTFLLMTASVDFTKSMLLAMLAVFSRMQDKIRRKYL